MNLIELLTGESRKDPEKEPDTSVVIDLETLTEETVPVAETHENRPLLDALREVIDPELGVNIVDLGLVYAVEKRDERVDVVLTMTTPACPLSAVIEQEVRDALFDAIDRLDEVRVAVVFEPSWNPSMMSERARTQLGR